MPESPRYLIAAGEKEKGIEVLQQMAKVNKAKLPPGNLRIETEVFVSSLLDKNFAVIIPKRAYFALTLFGGESKN